MVRALLCLLAFTGVASTVRGQAAEPAAAPAAAARQPEATSVSSGLLGPFLVGCTAKFALSGLTSSYNSGNWHTFQTDARALLDAIKAEPDATKADRGEALTDCRRTEKTAGEEAAIAALDYSARYIVLAWVGNDGFGKTQLMRAVVHNPEPEPYSADVPGIRSLTEVVLSSSIDARAVSLYTSTRENDPFAELAPEFIKAVFAPLSTTIAGLLGTVSGKQLERAYHPAEEAKAPALTVTIKGVALPFPRASIKLQMRMKDLESADDFRSAVDALGTKLLFDGAGRSNSARRQVTTLVDRLPELASEHCAARPAPAPQQSASASSRGVSASRRADIRAGIDRDADRHASGCRDALDKEIKRVYDVAIAATPDDEKDIIEDVDKQFRALAVSGLATTTQLDVTFKNRPLTHFSFGAGSAVAPYARLNRVRAKIDDDTKNLVSDPLSRVITLAFVNWSRKGYDENAAEISRAERVRIFAGAALTPDFGIVGGVNVLLFRGIGVIAGGGALFGKGADAEEIGKPPAATSDPFKMALTRVGFIGIAYSYK